MVITLLGTLKPLIQGPRLVVQIVLLIVFLYFFGQPAITRFLKKEVVVVETLKQTDGIPSPAITISVPAQAKHHSCFDKNVLAEDCLENAYLKQSEIIKSVIVGVSPQKEVNLTGQNIREDFTFTRAGIYFTLSLPLKIGSNVLKDKLQIVLNTSLSYLLFIHDPKYFLFNDNPTAIPGERRRLDTNEANPKKWHYRLELVEVNKLNLPTAPCNDDPNYSFVSCVRKSIAMKVQLEIKSVKYCK